MKRKINLQH